MSCCTVSTPLHSDVVITHGQAVKRVRGKCKNLCKSRCALEEEVNYCGTQSDTTHELTVFRPHHLWYASGAAVKAVNQIVLII